jgi:hypothetical protein
MYVQLKCDCTRWRTWGEVKGKLAIGVGTVLFTLPRNVMYPALLPLMCTPRLPVVDWTDAPRRFKWTRPFRRKTKSGFLRVCHHISKAVYKVSAHVAVRPVRVSWKSAQGRPYPFSYAQMKYHLLVYHETVWHSDNKERLGQVCAVRHGVRHLHYCSVFPGSDTMTLPAADAAWKVARFVSKQLAHCLWNISRPDNHPCAALGALSGGLASLIGRVAEPADRLLHVFLLCQRPAVYTLCCLYYRYNCTA